ncbi:MAG: addiction module protein [Deltaproteobacteria bacterium]|nr:addiction module protein [Deltaproteobacteria bacterium]
MLAKDILKEALQLDPRDRVDLVEELSASLDPSDLGPEWETEIRARIEDVDSGRVKSVPAAEVFARLEAKFGAK